jgi:TonB family protein
VSAATLLPNALAYSVQLAVLVLAVMAVVRGLRLVDARSQFSVWQGALVLALGLPVLGCLINASATVSGIDGRLSVLAVSASAGSAWVMSWNGIVALALVTGAGVRLTALAAGYVRVHQWRRRAVPWHGDVPPASDIDVRVSDAISGPVTIGIVKPLVLVPPRFSGLPEPVRRAVLWHEALHARRRDPLQILIAELWCACLWFHPAARALVSRLELAREMMLDRETIAMTGDRRAYAQALLAFATADSGPTAAAFTRRSHVIRRIDAIRHEVPAMTITRRRYAFLVVSALSVGTTVVAATVAPMPGGAAVEALPGRQDPVQPGKGVQMPRVVREVKPEYTPEALKAKIQGSVIMSVVVEADGSVGRVAVVQSLDQTYGLDEQALTAMTQWSFEPGRNDGNTVPVEVQVEMTFTLKP